MSDLRLTDLAPVCQEHIPKLAVFDDGTGQEPRMGIDGGFAVKEIKLRILTGKVQVGFVEGADRSDIPPVAR